MQRTFNVTKAINARRRLTRDLEILERYQQGYGATEISRHYSIDRCHVLKIIRSFKDEGIIMEAKEKKPWTI